jgi:hypothetical protein
MVVMRMGVRGVSVRLVNWLRGGEDEAAGFDALGANQIIGQSADFMSGAAKQDDLETAFGVKVDVGRGDNPVKMLVLKVGEPARDFADVVVVDQGDDAHGFGFLVGDRLLDQRRAHQAANRLAPVRVAMLLAIAVELVEKFTTNRHAEPDERLFHAFVSLG